jgi:type VI secretion system protein ImpF
MTRIRPNQLLLPSVLDRLIDNEPDNPNEAPRDRGQLLRDLKASVQRDLENLLNTRVPFDALPQDLTLLQSSLFNYGIPDFNNVVKDSSGALEWMRLQIERVIKTFETRFQSVSVQLGDGSKSTTTRSVSFTIDGVLHAEPYPEPVTYTSKLSTTNNEFEVKDANQ